MSVSKLVGVGEVGGSPLLRKDRPQGHYFHQNSHQPDAYTKIVLNIFFGHGDVGSGAWLLGTAKLGMSGRMLRSSNLLAKKGSTAKWLPPRLTSAPIINQNDTSSLGLNRIKRGLGKGGGGFKLERT